MTTLVWHAIGLSLFLGVRLSMFFSVTSPLRTYHDKPDASIVFQFPMVLSPNVTVPLFMIAQVKPEFTALRLSVGCGTESGTETIAIGSNSWKIWTVRRG